MTHGTFTDWQERVEVFKRVADILASYSFDGDKGLCTDLGKHEANPVQTIYFFEQSMENFCDCYDWHDGTSTTIMAPSEIEREIFGAMAGCSKFKLLEDSNGFVYGEWINDAQAAHIDKNYQQFMDECGSQD